jgi:hypothetical protein
MALAGEVKDLATIETRDVTFPSDGFQMKGYLARPKAPGNHPAVIVLHEAFGLVDHERDIARRLANVGFIAFAPDIYSRVGPLKDPSNMGEVLPKMFGLPDAQLVRDFNAAAGFVRAQPGSNGKVGCVGFCVGGRWTLLFACSSDKVTPRSTAGAASSTAPLPMLSPPPSGLRRSSTWCRNSIARSTSYAARRIKTRRRPSPRNCADVLKRPARNSSSTCSRTRVTLFLLIIGQVTVKKRPSSCGPRWWPSSRPT